MSLNVDLIKSKSWVEAIITIVISSLFALTTVSLIIILLKIAGFQLDVSELVNFAFKDVISNSSDLAQILFWSTPLLLTGLSVAIAFQSGLFNIGAQGQMMMGAMWAGIWASSIIPNLLPFLEFPLFMIPSTMIMGIIFGAFWGYIPGYLKARTGAHEVIVTIMMNLIAINIANILVGSQTYSPFIDKTSLNAYNQTDMISESAQIPVINKELSTFLDWSIIVGVLVVILLQFLLFKTNFGFKLRAVGLNPVTAETTGINSKKMTILSMSIAGGVAGLGGALLVMGDIRYVIGIESSYGFDGIAVALIGQNIPFGVGLAAILFGFLKQSGVNLGENTDIPPEIIVALQSWIILFIAAPLIARKTYAFLTLKREKPKEEEN